MKIFIVLAALLAAGSFSFLEWQRADRRNLAFRLGATLLAVIALALWGWRPTWQRPAPTASNGGEIAALWTAGADMAASSFHEKFALPDTTTATPAGAVVVPDVGTLRRRFPKIGTLHIYGDGLEAFDLEAWRGLNVVYHPPPPSQEPAFTFVRCPRVLPLGETLTIQGRVSGLATTITLEAPDGTTTGATVFPADAHGDAGFTVTGAPPPAAGRFTWRLRLGKDGETESLGVAVVAPTLPRVLALAGAPNFDTAALRRWFEGAGGTFVARTLVGQDRFRFESAHDPPPQFAALDAVFLAGFDLVLADGRALAALAPPEHDALRAAVADTGLGVLVLADDADPAAIGPALFPWKLSPSAGEENDLRLARVQWPGQPTVASEIPLPVAPFQVAPQDGQTPLMRDGQGRTLAVAAERGRGQVALTLVRETGRWTRENDFRSFAAYWSELFSRLARPASAADAGGRWTLVGGEAGPVFVDQPLDLLWTGPTPPAPATATVTAEADGRPVTLALAASGEHWQGRFWPRGAGWHQVGTLDFFVHPAGSWAALDAARRRAATARFAEESMVATRHPANAAPLETAPIPAGGWFLLFLAAAGYLWVERRMGRNAAVSSSPSG